MDDIQKAFNRAAIRADLGFNSSVEDLKRDLDSIAKPRFVPISGRPCVTNPATLLTMKDDI